MTKRYDIRNSFLLLALSLAIFAFVGSFSVTISDQQPAFVPSVVTSTYTATITMSADNVAKLTSTATEDQQNAIIIMPGGATPAQLPDVNSWDFNAHIFMEFSIPVVRAADIQLDPIFTEDGLKYEDYGEWVPFFTFTPDSSWIEVENKIEDGVSYSVWMYEKTVDPGESYTPLCEEFSMPNFRVRNGICGNLDYGTEIAEKMENVDINHYGLQGSLKGTPEQLWSLLK